MRRNGQGNDGGERVPLPARQPLMCKTEQVKRQHRSREQNVGHQLPGEPWQAGSHAQARDYEKRQPWSPAEAVDTQADGEQPGHQCALQDDARPEGEGNARPQKQAVQRRAARQRHAGEGHREIAAGVGKDDREAVPDGRRQQHQRHGRAGQNPGRTTGGIRMAGKTSGRLAARNQTVRHRF